MNLIKTGQWYWRENEISFKSFQLLKKEQKLQHLEFLSTLKREDLSTNDLTIIEVYKPAILQGEKTKFLEL